MDISSSEEADTLNAIAEKENVDTNDSAGVDSHNTSIKKKPGKESKSRNRNKKEWVRPIRKPSEKEERTMFGKALKIMLKLCMDNHVHLLGNDYRIQNKGGTIGLKLTGEIADCLMIDWDS